MVKAEKIDELVSSSLSSIHSKYGPFSSDKKPYHNKEHTEDVISASQQIGSLAVAQSLISPDDLPLLKLAAAYHDIVHGLPGHASENLSIETVTKKMTYEKVFTEEVINKVANMIEATKTHMIDGVFSQSASSDYLTQIIADSDLSALGSVNYWDRAQKYYLETHGVKILEQEAEARQKFLEFQIEFLQMHNYYTEEAKTIFSHKEENIAQLRSYLADLLF
jgi:predicted metal-dependent HD superfamily phosphohydrolase